MQLDTSKAKRRVRTVLALRRCLVALLWVTAIAFRGWAVADEPRLYTRFVVRDGYVAIDSEATRLDLGERKPIFEACGLSTDAVRLELIEYLDRLLKSRGKVLETVAIGPVGDGAANSASAAAALRNLSKTDPETARLYALDSTWRDAEQRFTAWVAAHSADQPPVTLGSRALKDAYEPVFDDVRFADVPIFPATEGFDPTDIDTARRGDAVFSLVPPFGHADTKLRPKNNREEWGNRRRELNDQLLAPFACKLWYRDAITGWVQDYLDMRGISVDVFRTERDEKESPLLAPEPQYKAGVAPERPRFIRKDGGSRVGGSRVILSADPLLDTVYVELDPNSEWSTLRQVLYLLLPTPDWQAVFSSPASYLCIQVLQLPGGQRKMVRLSLTEGAGSRLELAGMYLTRRALEERLRRLETVGMTAGMNFPTKDEAKQRKAVSLIVEKADSAALTTGSGGDAPAMPACDGAPGTSPVLRSEQKSDPLSSAENNDIASPARPDAKALTDDPERHNQLLLGVEQSQGKPVLFSLGYSRTGLTKDDTLSINVGQQGKASGNVQYTRDFLGFDTFNRRVQLTARAFSNYDPDRTSLAPGADERSNGGEIRATVDLWRDWSGTFGQLGLNASYRDIDLTSQDASPYKTRISLLDVNFIFAKSSYGTPASHHLDFSASVAVGQSSNPRETFGKLGFDLAYNRFVGAFARWDVRANAHLIGANAPQVEWPVFGGEDSVRGYRLDSAVAHSTWVIQNEFWIPVDGLVSNNEALARTLRRSVAIAVFADVGGLRDSSNALSGTNFGAGAGLRYRLNDSLMLRLDWARAVGGNSGLASPSGYFYFTVTSARLL